MAAGGSKKGTDKGTNKSGPAGGGPGKVDGSKGAGGSNAPSKGAGPSGAGTGKGGGSKNPSGPSGGGPGKLGSNGTGANAGPGGSNAPARDTSLEGQKGPANSGNFLDEFTKRKMMPTEDPVFNTFLDVLGALTPIGWGLTATAAIQAATGDMGTPSNPEGIHGNKGGGGADKNNGATTPFRGTEAASNAPAGGSLSSGNGSPAIEATKRKLKSFASTAGTLSPANLLYSGSAQSLA